MRQLEHLYRQHGSAILRYLRRISWQEDAAEDLLQETFTQALGRIDHLTQATSSRAWLFGIARNLGRNAARRRRHFAELPPQVPAPATRETDERLERMRRQIANLPEPRREALQLRLQDELSYEEIAAVLEIPVGTVRSRLHNAVRQLREAMGKE